MYQKILLTILYTAVGTVLLLGAIACDDDVSGEGNASSADGDSDTDGDADVDNDGPADCSNGPLSTSVANCNPTLPTLSGDYYQDCVDVINAFRAQCQCLPPLSRWTDGEDCANQQAEYDYENQSAHGGYSAGICEGGWAQCECPGWNSAESITGGSDWGESCLAMMWHEVDNPGGIQGHYEAMSSTSHTQVACGIYSGAEGETWALQNYQ